ncbi:MAG TPA: PEGA domain-containing protein [Candidatus Synoicihabitans sp.]|nr:PEGA domain-containing protein [Candidatus Synoicihabitans sp.]
MRGTTDLVRIESNPSGAKVRLSTGDSGVTPVSFELPRKNPVTVEFEKEGFERVTMTLSPTRSKRGSIATGGNALIGGAIGGAIDGSTGAALDLQPNPLVVNLDVAPPPPSLANWPALKPGITRRDVKKLLGEPADISDDTGAQVWTYPDGGKIQFRNFFVDTWGRPET